MTEIIVLTHGSYADGLFNTLKLFVAQPEHLTFLGLDEDLAMFQDKVRAMILDSPASELLIFVDLFGGTPFNTVAALLGDERARHKKLEVITGINLPMLLEAALNQEHCGLRELKEMALTAGRQGIRDLFAEINAKGVNQ